ncbi:UDP-N-acetylmuramate dehydrogenase [Anaerocolumna xylanovorans]|uniref:UDP-N-acetylenolpyruvoylglucosamine reductase n=1 Tax=Anaerocolumna xylanovorans DSM 12503 TaxID=1121345 RepID=A0A1M7Y863_9FIRM|nr:UDP-N-acetylmuramate dehydrogenase [Anaerocolumna xylanovorans]SHO48822.1 UDP-N-acetylmuramate dehydrogenase [Anaerocolumna xylanovorans DSM 12503]
MSEVFYQRLQSLFKGEQIKTEELLARHTSFQIGGPADYFLLPEEENQVAEAIKLCKEEKMPFFILGKGSNLLVSDRGYHGVIIKLAKNFSRIEIEGNKVTAQSGASLSKMAEEIAKRSLTGFEFASGIPGTLGGAVTMNAGAYGGEMKDIICDATVLDTDGRIRFLNKDELRLGYRQSIVQEEKMVVLSVSLLLKEGKEEDIRAAMAELTKKRKEKQPLEYPSAGSTFKRPEGHFAGKLIMDSGLRGYSVGNAEVSEKHCGFVINKGGATALEVYTLIQDVIRIVYEKQGVRLEPEVRLLGEF